MILLQILKKPVVHSVLSQKLYMENPGDKDPVPLCFVVEHQEEQERIHKEGLG